MFDVYSPSSKRLSLAKCVNINRQQAAATSARVVIPWILLIYFAGLQDKVLHFRSIQHFLVRAFVLLF